MFDNRNSEHTGTARVRRAEVADAPTLARLNTTVQGVHVALLPQRFEAAPDPEEVEGFFANALQLPNHVLGICETAHGEVAYIWFEEQARPASPFTKASRQLYIHHLSVEREARARGVATALLEWAYQHARKRGIGEVALDHWAANGGASNYFGGRGFEIQRVIMQRAVPEAP